jgi:2-methylcitrate dehydratase PrpD
MGQIVEKLANFTIKTQFGDIPQEIVHESKRALLDSIGCAVAALSIDAGKVFVELARRLGGPPESTVMGTRKKVSCINAAFANAELINALDFDAMCVRHALPVIIASSFAMAESTSASGKNLIMAIALGHEVAARIPESTASGYEPIPDQPGKGKLVWASVAGYASSAFGAAAGAGKLLNLDQEKMANAIGAAGYVCMPNVVRKFAVTLPVRMSKYGMFGWGAQGGITAALLAQVGFIGDTDVFEGKFGFLRFTGSMPEWKDPNSLDDLGTKWKQTITFKEYPIFYSGAGVVEQFVKVIEKNNLQPDEIKKVKVKIWPYNTGFNVQNELKTVQDCCFNLPYAIACAAYRIHPTNWLESGVRHDLRILEFVKRVEISGKENEFDLSILGPSQRLQSNFVAEVEANGQIFKEESSHHKGEPRPEYRITDQEIIDKFRNNVSKILSEDQINKSIETIFGLEKLQDVADLAAMLRPVNSKSR